MAAPTQLPLSQHGVDADDSRPFQYISVGDSILPAKRDEDAEDSCPFQYVRVRDTILPPQLQHPSETAKVEVVELPHLLPLRRPGLCSIQQRRQDDRSVHFEFGVEMEVVIIPNCALQTAKGLPGF
nr:unnamed protein product [Spirometra erinaceieuropaei]